MKLSDYKEDYYLFSGKVSDLTRQMAFAGIAIIWVFKKTLEGQFIIEDELVWPATLISLSLLFDISQYIYQTIVWGIFFNKYEKKGTKQDDDILAPRCMNYPANVLFWLKVILLLISYVMIITYLINNITNDKSIISLLFN